MRYAVTYTLPILLALSSHAQVQPFTLHQSEGPTGGPAPTTITIQTAAGSRAVYQQSPGSEPTALSPRTVTLPDEGKRFLITDELKLISTYYLTPRDITAHKTPKSFPVCDSGSGATLTAQAHLLGVLAFRYESLLRGGAEKHTHWYAPKLNCFPLQYEVHTLDSGGWKRIFSRIPTQLDRYAPISPPNTKKPTSPANAAHPSAPNPTTPPSKTPSTASTATTTNPNNSNHHSKENPSSPHHSGC